MSSPRVGPLGIRLAAAFVGVAIAAIAVFAVAVLIADRGNFASLATTQRAQTADAVVAALQDEYRYGSSWSSANLQPAVALADSAGVALSLTDQNGNSVVAAGPQGLFADSTSVVVERRLSVGTSALGTVKLAFPSGGLSTSERRLRNALATGVGWGAVLAILGALVVGVIVTRGLVRPIRHLSTTARSLERGDSGARVGLRTGPGELGELGRAFDAMAASLERQDRLRRDLVADVAHELRTPIAVLQAETEALVDGMTAATPEALSSLHEESVRLGRMVEDLQTLASAEAAGLHLERRPLNLSRVAAEAADSLATRFRSAGVQLEQSLPPVAVMGDPDRLYQVVGNLLANAVKFTPAGGKVTLRVARHRKDAVLEITDTGPGVPTDERRLVWERFYRGETGRLAAGSGIGLAVVKELVDAHGGSVGLESPDGGGARFVVRLPLATTQLSPAT